MKLAVAAEGEHEIGGLLSHEPGDSVAEVWIRRLMGLTAADALTLWPLKLSGSQLGAARAGHGESETAQTAYELALRQACDGLVLFRDTDRDIDEKRPLIDQGLRRAAAAAGRPLIAVLALQVRMLEAWLLADAGAFERAFRRRRPALLKSPEELWGKRADPSSNHPKHVYARVLRELALPAQRVTAVRIAEAADLEVLARECPQGFGRFKRDFERAFRTFDCVVAADGADGIGVSNDLPWPPLKTDLKHFRDTTCGAASGQRNAVIMGRKTWDSVPAKHRPLLGRLNIVISRGAVALAGDARVARSLDEALTIASLEPAVDQLFVIGGAEIYRQAFEHVRCRDVILTRVQGTFVTDAHIPDVSVRFVRRDDETVAFTEQGLDCKIERWRRRGR